MSDEPKKPDPVDDLKQGLGLLFRAARTAAQKLPTEKVEAVVKQGAREVGRALESVASTVDREVFGKKKSEAPPPSPPPDPSAPPVNPSGSPGGPSGS